MVLCIECSSLFDKLCKGKVKTLTDSKYWNYVKGWNRGHAKARFHTKSTHFLGGPPPFFKGGQGGKPRGHTGKFPLWGWIGLAKLQVL